MNEDNNNIEENDGANNKSDKSFVFTEQNKFDDQSICEKTGHTLIRWGKNAWRGIEYAIKKPYNALSKGISKAWNAGWGNRWTNFTNGCSEGWQEIKFKQSRHGLYEASNEANKNDVSVVKIY